MSKILWFLGSILMGVLLSLPFAGLGLFFTVLLARFLTNILSAFTAFLPIEFLPMIFFRAVHDPGCLDFLIPYGGIAGGILGLVAGFNWVWSIGKQ